MYGGMCGASSLRPQSAPTPCPTASTPTPLLCPSVPSSRRDPVDLVRFAAIDAMTGVLPSASASLGASKLGSSTREDTVARQRRGRAWRLLAAQGGQQVTVPGAGDKGAMKLVDVVGRLLLLALRKAGGSAARFCVAAGAVASLAESCMASQTAGTSRHGSSVDVDRVMAVLAGELGGLVEASLPAAQRCAVIEALLYLQVRDRECLCVCVCECGVVPDCRGECSCCVWEHVCLCEAQLLAVRGLDRARQCSWCCVCDVDGCVGGPAARMGFCGLFVCADGPGYLDARLESI